MKIRMTATEADTLPQISVTVNSDGNYTGIWLFESDDQELDPNDPDDVAFAQECLEADNRVIRYEIL